MAAVTNAFAPTASTANAETYVSDAFTPVEGDLLVALVTAAATVDAGAITSSANGVTTWTRVDRSASSTDLHSQYVFIADQLVTASPGSMTVTFDCTGDQATGAIVMVARVSGMTKTGATAIKQSTKLDNGTGGTTPVFTFAGSCLTGNPTLVVLGQVSTAGSTPPTNWTEAADTSFSTPVIGGTYVYRNSGFTGTVVTWGDVETAHGGIAVELDASAASSPATGTGSLTLGVAAAAGTAVATGTGSLTLGVAAAAGAAVATGTGSLTLGVAAAAGAAVATGTGSLTLGAAAATAPQVITNLVTNSSFETGTTGWTPGTGGPSLSNPASNPFVGTKSLRATSFSSDISPYTDVAGIIPASQYRVSGYLRGSTFSQDEFTAQFMTAGSPNGAATTIAGVASPDRTSLSALTAPSGADGLRITVKGLTGGFGDTITWDAFMVTEGTTLHDYFDGDTTDTATDVYDWTGTAHGSTSTRATVGVAAVASGTGSLTLGAAAATAPQVVTNLFPNPSFETNTTGWGNINGAGLATSTAANVVAGSQSLKITAVSGNNSMGAATNPSVSLGEVETTEPHTFSVTVFTAETGIDARLNITYYSGVTPLNGTSLVNVPIVGSTPTRLSRTFTPSSGASDASISITFRRGAGDYTGGELFYVDALAFTEGSTLHDYFDGSTTDTGTYDYAWTGTAHASTSTRTAGGVAGVATSSGSLTLGGSATATVATSATGSLTLAATGAAAGDEELAATGTGSLTLSGAGTAQVAATGTGSLTLAGTGTAQVAATGTGSLELAGAGAAEVTATGAGSLSLSGTATAEAAATGTGSLVLAGTGAGVGDVSGAATLALSASAAAEAAVAATGSLTLAGAATAAAEATSAGSLTLVGAGETQATATGTGSLTLSGSAAAEVAATATGSLTLTATGAATTEGAATGSGSLTLSSSAEAQAAATGSGALTLIATGTTEASVTGAGSLTLAGTVTVEAPATATASIILEATAAAEADVIATGSLTLAATGTAVGEGAAEGAGSLTLGGTVAGAGAAAGTGALSFSGTIAGVAASAGTATLTFVSTGQLAAMATGAATLTLGALAAAGVFVEVTATVYGPFGRSVSSRGPVGRVVVADGPRGRSITNEGPMSEILGTAGPDQHELVTTGPGA